MGKINVNNLFNNKGFQVFVTIMAIFIVIIVHILTITTYIVILVTFWVIQFMDMIKIMGGKVCGYFKTKKENWET